jgi:hypothetical protein
MDASLLRRILRALVAIWVVAISLAWVWARLEFPEGTLPFGPALILVAVVGAFLSVRVKGNLLGPSLLVGGSAGLIYDVGTAYAKASLNSPTPWPLEHLAAWLGAWAGPIGFLTISVLFVLFPEGHFIGRRKWFIPVLSIPILLTAVGAIALWQLSTTDLVLVSSTNDPTFRYPEYAMVNSAFILTAIPLPFVTAISLFVRFWRSGSVERLQIKWLASSAVFAPVFMLAMLRLFPSVSDVAVYNIALSTLPLAIAVAVSRYRLYDLGRVVSSTVSYAIIVVVLGSLFAFCVVAVPNLVIGTGTAPPLFVAASTLLVAALFNPVRRRVQRWVDRRFNRARYDSQRVMDEYSVALRDQVDPEEVVDGWVGVVSETMQPVSVGVWMRGIR